jgi:class 3 adenylate cyclase
MPAPLTQDPPLQAANALLAHLRQHPEDALRPSRELAERFGLPASFVQSVLAEVRPPLTSEGPSGPDFRESISRVKSLGSRLNRSFEKLTANPSRFVVGSSLVAFFLCLGIFALDAGISRTGSSIRIEDGGILAVIVITFSMHVACYFRWGMSRYPLYGGLTIWVISAATAMVSVWFNARAESPFAQFAAVMAAAIGMLMLSLIYTGICAAVALGGGYFHARRQERIEEEMSRQDMLERYFQLQERLAQGGGQHRVSSWLDESPPAQVFRKAPFVIAIGVSVSLALARMILNAVSGIGQTTPGGGGAVQILAITTQLALAFVGIALYAAIGLFSPSVGRALVLTVTAAAASFATNLLPIGRSGFSSLVRTPNLIGAGIMLLFFMAVAAFGAIGAVLQRRAAREASLRGNDPATIVAEMLRIQWRLADHSSNVCVMVVDAAKSSVMKADADPLAVEYSFREYQEWLEDISRKLEGRVHSTAGDGAVVAFSDCKSAFTAARRIQTDLDRFNREVNRLSMPFRLRIGLHVGQVVGDLDEVEFTEVIDIAAHIQDAAPIAGIAASDAVVASLVEDEFVPLAKEIDGHKVHLALNPTED